MRKTHATVQVAASLMEDPHEQHWGYELSKRSGIRSGALYPILHRMLAEGWLSDGWEELNESARKRPPRRYYELTDLGLFNLGALLRQASQETRFRAVLGGQT